MNDDAMWYNGTFLPTIFRPLPPGMRGMTFVWVRTSSLTSAEARDFPPGGHSSGFLPAEQWPTSHASSRAHLASTDDLPSKYYEMVM